MSASVKSYIGTWHDYANGVWTLTLPEREAGVLAAALLIFTGFVASQAWNITKFILHQTRVTDGVRDGLWHQQQVAIRNSDGHMHALWSLLSLAGAWFRLLGTTRTAARSFVLVFFSLASLVAWSAAQLFVSYIWTSSGNNYLVGSGLCGVVYPVTANLTRNSEKASVWQVYYGNRLEEAATYERPCYSQDPDPALCGRLPVPRLNWTAGDGGCPVLEDALCIKTNTTPVVMDSGFINSNDHLGVNAEPKDTIEYRRIATCAPLQGTHAFYNKSEALALGYQFEYYYGHNYILGTNYTFAYGVINRFRVGDYRLATFEYDPTPGLKVTWKPNSTMFDRTDAKISLFFLITDYLRYYAPVYDMWFLTSNSFNESTIANTSDGPVELWEPFHFVRIMACEEVHQLCNRNLPGAAVDQCANFTLAVDQVALSQKMALSPRQNSTWVRLRAALLETSLFDIAWKLSEPIEAARSVLDGSQYAKLPVNQWRREIGRWFSIGLAMVQRGMVEFVTGPALEEVQQYFVDVGGDWAVLDDCRAQRVRGVTGVRNFDMKGMLVLLALGVSVAVVGLTLDTIVGSAHAILHKGEERRLLWLMDNVFQIQRVAFEGKGVGGWRKADATVPVTAEGSFPRVDGTEKSYPRLSGVVYVTTGGAKTGEDIAADRLSLDSNCVDEQSSGPIGSPTR